VTTNASLSGANDEEDSEPKPWFAIPAAGRRFRWPGVGIFVVRAAARRSDECRSS
jgi:hypothetical protein